MIRCNCNWDVPTKLNFYKITLLENLGVVLVTVVGKKSVIL